MSELEETRPEADGPDGRDTGEGEPGFLEMATDPSGVPVVKLCGEIDISNANQVGAELARFLRAGTRRLVVDMSALEFMDSSGIAMLLHAAAQLDSISVRRPSPVVRRIIEATGLEAALPIES
jgi:anti-anti-sigma factor